MHISKKLAEAREAGKPTFSFEFFPPKTAQGVQNLYDRMDRMHALGPAFIDVTWGAGGRLSSLTCEMVKVAQNTYGLETCMHLTCTDMERSKVDDALKQAYDAGCHNILALRGDPPREKEKWEAIEGGFRYAKDLVLYIKEKYGDHFDIGVAGYPEGCDDEKDVDVLIDHLKEKVDAGGTFVVTQMCYDAELFVNWMRKCHAKGIDVPLIPGIMPIHTHAAFLRRANWTQCHIPDDWTTSLDPVKNDDAAARDVGAGLVAKFCRKLLGAGVTNLHFYTMNLAQATRMVLDELSLLPSSSETPPKPLPWRQSLGLNRRDENVRPIFWRNRNRSYVERTQEWDEFPNGRWGDSRSPAFGELDAYNIGLKGTNESNRKIWGEPASIADISDLFVRYMCGHVECLPWSEARISSEADVLRKNLVNLNERCILTINSQPPVNGAKSSDPKYGWGPRGGYVYQKAYLEVLLHPSLYATLMSRMEAKPDLTYYAVDSSGSLATNAATDGPNAVTWGVFPGKEIVQPTIVETVSFLAWKDEFFRLGEEWAACYEKASRSRGVVEDMMKSWYLINIVHNDFQNDAGIFPVFEGLALEEKFKSEKDIVNGDVDGVVNGHDEAKNTVNGTVNGHNNDRVTNGTTPSNTTSSSSSRPADGDQSSQSLYSAPTNGLPNGGYNLDLKPEKDIKHDYGHAHETPSDVNI